MRTLVLLCWALSLASAAVAQERVHPAARTRTDASVPDPFARSRVHGMVRVGDPAPDFELTSSTGDDVTLSRLRGDWLLLRFADDRQELADQAGMKEELDRMGVRLIAICSDKPQTLHTFVQRLALPFDILSDATGEVSAIYGFYDPSTLGAQPGIVIVDRRGVVRMTLQGGAPDDQVIELTRFTMASVQPQP
jgi:thioredoxin-dependent peroxiredoxin